MSIASSSSAFVHPTSYDAPPTSAGRTRARSLTPSPPASPPPLIQPGARSRRAPPRLDLTMPPDTTSRLGRHTPDGSPDSNDQDHEMFVTPAASARPSIISPIVSDGSGSGPAGLGIDMSGRGEHGGFQSKQARDSREQGYFEQVETLSEQDAGYAHGDGEKASLHRARSEEAASGPTHVRAPSHRNTQTLPTVPAWHMINTRNGVVSSYTSARSPNTSPVIAAFPSLPGIMARVRKISPTQAKQFSEQQNAYLPPLLPDENGASGSKSLPPQYDVPANIPSDVPHGYDPSGAARWSKLGDGHRDKRVRAISANGRGHARISSGSGVMLGLPSGTGKFSDSQAYWLGLYFAFNLGLTLFNKYVLVSFPFPYTLTGLHALSGCVGCWVALERGAFKPARLTRRENLTLAAFSVLYTINIAVSNISLQLVTVPFHQVVRASTPFFTILISTTLLRTRFTLSKMVALLPVVAGVGLATYGDYYFTAWGLVLTLLGTFLAAMKTVVTNLIQTGGGGRLRLHPLDLLLRMSPLAFVQCVIYGWYSGELDRVRMYGATQMTQGKAIALLVNGVIACGLNIVSFTANKKSGPLTMTVSANCKQVITIALAVVLFDLHISATNAIGILLTLVGGAWYGFVEYREKKRRQAKLERA